MLLREQIVGPARFDPAFRRYIATWAYRHPTPSDFFRFMSSATGEDLSWWWRGWYFNNWQLDMGIASAVYTHGKPADGMDVVLATRQKLVIPVTLRIDFADGSRREQRVPVEVWRQGGAPQLHLSTDRPVARLTLDPDHQLPDADRGNDTLALP